MKDYKDIIYVIPILLMIIGIAFLTSSKSSTSDNLKPLEGNELKLWSNRGDTIFKNDTAVAIFEHYEFEYNPNHKNKNILPELCFIQIDDNSDNTFDLVRYIHTIHPSIKIQVESKDQYDKINFWKSKINN